MYVQFIVCALAMYLTVHLTKIRPRRKFPFLHPFHLSYVTSFIMKGGIDGKVKCSMFINVCIQWSKFFMKINYFSVVQHYLFSPYNLYCVFFIVHNLIGEVISTQPACSEMPVVNTEQNILIHFFVVSRCIPHIAEQAETSAKTLRCVENGMFNSYYRINLYVWLFVHTLLGN